MQNAPRDKRCVAVEVYYEQVAVKFLGRFRHGERLPRLEIGHDALHVASPCPSARLQHRRQQEEERQARL